MNLRTSLTKTKTNVVQYLQYLCAAVTYYFTFPDDAKYYFFLQLVVGILIDLVFKP